MLTTATQPICCSFSTISKLVFTYIYTLWKKPEVLQNCNLEMKIEEFVFKIVEPNFIIDMYNIIHRYLLHTKTCDVKLQKLK